MPILPTRRVSSVKKGWPHTKGKISKEVVQGVMGRAKPLCSAPMWNEVGILKSSAVSSGFGEQWEKL